MSPSLCVRSLKKKQDFQTLYKNHKTYHGPFFKVFYRETESGYLSYAIAISRKTEPLSTKRNRERRRIKEILKKEAPATQKDILIIPKKNLFCPPQKHEVLKKEIKSFLSILK